MSEGYIRLYRWDGVAIQFAPTLEGISEAVSHLDDDVTDIKFFGPYGAAAEPIAPVWLESFCPEQSGGSWIFEIEAWGRYAPFPPSGMPDCSRRNLVYVNVQTGDCSRPNMNLLRAAEFGEAEWAYFCQTRNSLWAPMYDYGIWGMAGAEISEKAQCLQGEVA